MSGLLSPLRVGRMTGSRVPKVLGLSPHGGAEDVLREMVREYLDAPAEPSGNFVTEYGEAHEHEAIELYELARGVSVHNTGLDQMTALHPYLDWGAATPDGTVWEDGTLVGVLDAKNPWRARYTHWNQRPDIEAQLRWQTECLQCDWADLAIRFPEGLVPPSRVDYDPAWLPTVQPRLEDFMAEFAAVVADEERAAAYLEPLEDQRSDPEWLGQVANYLELDAVVKAMEAAREEAKAELVALAVAARDDALTEVKKYSVRGGGVLLTRSLRRPAAPYKALAEAHYSAEEIEAARPEPGGEPTWTLTRSR